MTAIDECTASPNEKAMRDLGKRCIELANEIQVEVDSQTTKEPASLFKTAKNAVWGEETAKCLEQRTKDLDVLLKSSLKTLLAHIRYLDTHSRILPPVPVMQCNMHHAIMSPC